MSINLLPRYDRFLLSLKDHEVAAALTRPELLMDEVTVGSKMVQMVYAPFDHVNAEARIVIVGLTPGRQQAVNALKSASEALGSGLQLEAASARAKVFASFSGPMRANLVRMLDRIGVSRHLGVESAAQLWTTHAHLAHFTSLLRYPVFVDQKDWSGQPDAVRTLGIRKWLDDYTGAELALFRDAILVPLGPRVSAGLSYLVEQGRLDANRILNGMPHPSGANAERIACFLGDKPARLVSAKTNANALITAREMIMSRVSAL